MSLYCYSQLFIAIAIVFDLASFQFKQRQSIVGCLCIAGVLICSHFVLLQQWTAASLMAIATLRYFCSLFSTSRWLMLGFLIASTGAFALTYAGLTSLLCFLGSAIQTTAAFSQRDKQLRVLMMLGTSFWLIHNITIGSPLAVLMELLFIGSNLIGFYRFYLANNDVPH